MTDLMNVFGPGPRDYNRAVYRFSEDMEEMVRNGVSEESEKFQRVKAQWAYACALRDHYETHSSSARRNASAT